MKDKPTDSLIERIDKAIERFRPVFGDAAEINAICEEIYEFLTDFRNRLSPPVIEGELANYERAIELLNRIYNFFEVSKDADPVRTPSWVRWQKVVTEIIDSYAALHDELGRARKELKLAEEIRLKLLDENIRLQAALGEPNTN